jgi:uracil-DNA glycosylase
MTLTIPAPWRPLLQSATDSPSFQKLAAFVNAARAKHTVFPPADEVFAALALTPPDAVRVVLLGQDPYHDDGQAHGLCFSVKPPTPPPPSLKNIFAELHEDLGCAVPSHGDLTAWAERGVLLVNAVLTVEAHKPASHKDQGWEEFTDAVVAAVNGLPRPVVFCLWGNFAKKKGALVDRARHAVVEGAHPSPLSVKKFKGSRPFSKINAALQAQGQPPLDWTLPP